MKVGDQVKHSRFDMTGTILKFDGKLVLVDWQGWQRAWCGKQWVLPL